jgi:hypothetical protein
MVARQMVWRVALLIGALVAVGCGPRNASLPRDTQTVDGMTIYIGVIPAELVQGHSIEPSDPDALHGGTPKGRSSHHLVVALFDAKTGTRITDARIKVGIGDHSYNHEPDKWLAPMQIDGTITYGNFFLMQGEGVWRIHLEIQRPGMAGSSEAVFAYEHAPNP